MRTKTLLAAGLLLTCAQVHSAPELTVYPYHGRQNGTSTISAGLIAGASTVWTTVTVAGGWTIQCTFTSGQLNAERSDSSFSVFGGASLSVFVPVVVPSTYQLPGWSNLPTTSCGDCTFYYKALGRDGSGSISAGTAGFNITLTPGAEALYANTSVFQFCRAGQPQCCTPGCQQP